MRFRALLVLVLLTVLSGCGGGSTDRSGDTGSGERGRPTVYTVNYPLAFFAERIGGELVEVVFPVPADVDPAYWSPSVETIARYQQADAILLNGAGYARWIERASLPASRMVDTSVAFADRLIPIRDAVTHSHGPQGAHEHTGWAFTVWLDPTLAVEQARAVATALETRLTDAADTIRTRLAGLEQELMRIDVRLETAATKLGETPLLFSHPVYSYLIRRYGLNGTELHWEPDAVPDAAAWEAFRQALEARPARWMLWEAEPLEETAQRLRELGVRSVVFDPCANVPDDGDFLTVMADNAAALESVASAPSGRAR